MEEDSGEHKEEVKPRASGTRPMQAWSLALEIRTPSCNPTPVWKQRGPDLTHIEKNKKKRRGAGAF